MPVQRMENVSLPIDDEGEPAAPVLIDHGVGSLEHKFGEIAIIVVGGEPTVAVAGIRGAVVVDDGDRRQCAVD